MDVKPRPSDREHAAALEHAAVLSAARDDLAAGAYAQALGRAERVLGASPAPGIRSAALVVAGDAAYGLGDHATAAERYRHALQADELPPEAAHVALALGWSEVHLGRRDEARQAFLRVSREFPSDARAPIGLVLAAELIAQAGDPRLARRFLDRAVETYPDSPDADLARLDRSILLMGEGRIQEAARELQSLIRSGGAVVEERARLRRALAGKPAPGDPTRPGRDRLGVRAAGDGATPVSLERFAAPFLEGADDPETTPRVLHGLVLVGVEEQTWPQVEILTRHLVDRFPGYPASPELLGWVGDRAAAAREWPLVRSSYERLKARAPRAALAPKARVDLGEALLRTGAPAPARSELARALESGAEGEAPRALLLLAQAHEALGRPREALATYAELRRRDPAGEWAAASRLPHARLEQTLGRPSQARGLLEETVRRAGGEERTEASFRLGQVLAAAGDHGRALDWYMAAAYDSEQPSRWHRPARLGAGHALVALKRTRAAQAVYRSLLPAAGADPGAAGSVEEPELAGEAAYRLAELARAAGRRAEAADMYQTAARLFPAAPWRDRALVEAIRALAAAGDRAAAERVSRMLANPGPAPAGPAIPAVPVGAPAPSRR